MHTPNKTRTTAPTTTTHSSRHYRKDTCATNEISLFIASWSPTTNTVRIQTNDPRLISQLAKRKDCQPVVLGAADEFWKSFEFPKDLVWSRRLIARYHESLTKVVKAPDLTLECPPASQMPAGGVLTPESTLRGSKPGSTRNIRAMGGRVPVKRVAGCKVNGTSNNSHSNI